MLVIPQEIRWNTVSDSLKSYLENRGILVQICQDHKDDIDNDIFRIVNDTHITVNAIDFLKRMEPIAVALDRMQRDGMTIAVSVEIWRKLEEDLTGQPPEVFKHFKNRKEMALTPSHYLTNLCDHRFRGHNLTKEEKHSAFEYFETINNKFIPVIMALSTESKPFPSYIFGDQFKTMSPMTWWKSLTLKDPEKYFDWDNLKTSFLKMCLKLLTAVAATAGLERIFSTFGLVHSKLRNRLGMEKASKLTFIFRCLNQDCNKKATSLDWVFEREQESEDLTNIIESVPFLVSDQSDKD